jgi:hypothetical protein
MECSGVIIHVLLVLLLTLQSRTTHHSIVGSSTDSSTTSGSDAFNADAIVCASSRAAIASARNSARTRANAAASSSSSGTNRLNGPEFGVLRFESYGEGVVGVSNPAPLADTSDGVRESADGPTDDISSLDIPLDAADDSASKATCSGECGCDARHNGHVCRCVFGPFEPWRRDFGSSRNHLRMQC